MKKSVLPISEVLIPSIWRRQIEERIAKTIAVVRSLPTTKPLSRAKRAKIMAGQKDYNRRYALAKKATEELGMGHLFDVEDDD